MRKTTSRTILELSVGYLARENLRELRKYQTFRSFRKSWNREKQRQSGRGRPLSLLFLPRTMNPRSPARVGAKTGCKYKDEEMCTILIEAEKLAKDPKAPRMLFEIACAPALNQVNLRGKKGRRDVVSTNPYLPQLEVLLISDLIMLAKVYRLRGYTIKIYYL